MAKRYQVWHSYAITRFSNREQAIAFAYENEGMLIDTWIGENGEAIALPKATPISYWMRAGDVYTEVTPDEIESLKSQGFRFDDLRVSRA